MLASKIRTNYYNVVARCEFCNELYYVWKLDQDPTCPICGARNYREKSVDKELRFNG